MGLKIEALEETTRKIHGSGAARVRHVPFASGRGFHHATMRIQRSSSFSPGMPDPEIAQLIRGVSEERMRERVRRLSFPRNCFRQRGHNEEARDWVRGELVGLGCNTALSPQGNVVAAPLRRSDRVILVGAHYDSVAETPGADDNASAVATLLGCAEACAGLHEPPPVMFVAFNGEEDGLLGSREFVEKFLPSAGFGIRCAHILEMVGFASHEPGSQKGPPGLPVSLPDTGDFLGLLANRDSTGVMERVLGDARTYLPDFPVHGLGVMMGLERFFPVLHRSDHAPFWSCSLPAVMWTDTSEFRNPHYHQPSDTPETLDYAFLRRVTQLLTCSVCAMGTDGKAP